MVCPEWNRMTLLSFGGGLQPWRISCTSSNRKCYQGRSRLVLSLERSGYATRAVQLR